MPFLLSTSYYPVAVIVDLECEGSGQLLQMVIISSQRTFYLQCFIKVYDMEQVTFLPVPSISHPHNLAALDLSGCHLPSSFSFPQVKISNENSVCIP